MNNNNNNTTNQINRIIPLFNNPILMKKKFESTQNNNFKLKVNSALTDSNKNNKISFEKIIKLYTKGLKIYNTNLMQNLIPKSETLTLSSKTGLIANLKNDDQYKINLIYNNYLYLINRYFPFYIFFNSIFKTGLFLPTQIFKPQFLALKYKVTLIQGESASLAPSKTDLNKDNLKNIFFGSAFKSVGETSSNLELDKIRTKIKKLFRPSTIQLSNVKLGLEQNKQIKIIADNNFLSLLEDINSNKAIKTNLAPIATTPQQSARRGLGLGVFSSKGLQDKVIVNKLLQKGDSLLNELNSLIIKKNNLIKTSKLENLINLE